MEEVAHLGGGESLVVILLVGCGVVDVGQHVVDVASRFQGHESFLFVLVCLVVLLLVWTDRGRVV